MPKAKNESSFIKKKINITQLGSHTIYFRVFFSFFLTGGELSVIVEIGWRNNTQTQRKNNTLVPECYFSVAVVSCFAFRLLKPKPDLNVF